MSGKTRKPKTVHELLSYMHMLEDGKSFGYIHKTHGINEDRLRVLWLRYQKEGVAGLQKQPNIKADYALKRKIVLDIEENHLTLHAASLKYGASPQGIGVWLKTARTEGIAALSKCKKRGGQPGMGRPKKNGKPLTELERLRKENEDLRLEVALLKKVRALVEERNARLREIGHGPSKN
jgi:transposase-like protein